MTSFSTADLCRFLTTYRGIKNPQDALRALCGELIRDHGRWLDGAPRLFKEQLDAYLGESLVLDAPRARARSPFGWITLGDVTTPSSGWLSTHSARLQVGERLFDLRFYYDDDDRLAFDGSTLQEVMVHTGSVEKFIPSPYVDSIPVDGDYMFTPGVAADRDESNDLIRMRNLAWMITRHDPEHNAQTNGEMFLEKIRSAPHGTLHDPEGNAIVKMEQYGIVRDANPGPETFRQVVVRVRREIFIITFGWDSYAGETYRNATISPADRKLIETRELLPVGAEELLVPYDPMIAD